MFLSDRFLPSSGPKRRPEMKPAGADDSLRAEQNCEASGSWRILRGRRWKRYVLLKRRVCSGMLRSTITEKVNTFSHKNKSSLWLLFLKRTIPIEGPPLIEEVDANFGV
jgi:hypothetical protein